MTTQILGDFELDKEQLIGKGAWGEVYKGKQISLEREVAIKILKQELTQDDDFVRRFHREASCLAKLTSEHIIQVYGAGEHEGSHYFIMEYVQGVPLQKFIDRGRKFLADDVIYAGTAVARALKSAWNSPGKIIHRDIKPSNIMVSFSSSLIARRQPQDVATSTSTGLMDFDIKEANIKVMDFGLAKVSEGEKDATMVGTVIGTPKYISPEQGMGKAADIRSDIYSLGIVMYEMATGRIPFESESAMSLIRHHIYDTAVSLRQFNESIPVELEAVIMKCIQKEPDNRYNNPDDLLEDFEAVKQSREPQHAMASPAGGGATMVVQPIQQRKRWLVYVGATFGVVLLAGLIIFLVINKKTWTSSSTPPSLPMVPVTPVKPVEVKPSEKDISRQVDSLLIQAHTWVQNNNFAEAKEVLTEALSLEPGNTGVKKLLAEVRRMEKKEIEIAKMAEQKKEYKEFFKLGMEQMVKKNWSGARDAFEKAISIRDTVEVQARLKDVVGRAEREGAYKKILKKADQAEKQNKFEEAIKLYESAKNFTEDISSLQNHITRCYGILHSHWYEKGMNYLGDKKLLSAETAFRTALKYKKGDKDVLNRIKEIKDLIPPSMIFIEGGKFLMGKDNKSQELSSYFIGQYEVTNAKYKQFLDAIKETGDHSQCHPAEKKPGRSKDHTPEFWKNGKFPEGKENFPVCAIDWYDAYAYAKWCGKRLPTEAEWEKAARGMDKRIYPWGNSKKVRLNVKDLGLGMVNTVHSYLDDKSPYDCFDMGGNLSEWTVDSYGSVAVRKVVRGGNWHDYFDKARVYHREPYMAYERNKFVGFRCVKSVE